MAEYLSEVFSKYKIDEYLTGIEMVKNHISSLKDDYMINLPSTFGSRTAISRIILTKNQKIDPFEEYCLVIIVLFCTLSAKRKKWQKKADPHLGHHRNYLDKIKAVDSSEKKQLPNVVVIVMDDMGWGDISHFGSKAINTPNIDRLAQNGESMNVEGILPDEITIPEALKSTNSIWKYFSIHLKNLFKNVLQFKFYIDNEIVFSLSFFKGK
jgi:Sulfatase